jgi:hypothetical protein
MNTIRALLTAGLLSLSLGAAAVNYSDLWFNPQQPGSGLQVVQQGDTAFVTLFTYGGNGDPFWVVAPDARVYAYDAGGRPAFRGTLYRTRGTAFSGSYNPADSQVIAVGELYLSPNGDNGLVVDYNVNNVAVKLNLVRQTFEIPLAAGNYSGNFKLRMSHASGGQPYGTREYNADFLLTMSAEGVATLRVSDNVLGLCEYRGPYLQTGRYGSFEGTYTCQSGDTGPFQVSRLELTDTGVTGQLTLTGRDGVGRGRFGAVRQ